MSFEVSNTSQGSPDPLLHGNEDIAEDESHREDIYRGEPPDLAPAVPQPQVHHASLRSLSNVSVSSSSSSASKWSGLGLRRGALGTVLEMAINRWARATSGSSTSSSSSSSQSSTHTRVPRRKPNRQLSLATSTQNVHSENVIRARLKARGEGRTLPREFTLFLPKELAQRRYHPFNFHQHPVIDEEVEGQFKLDPNKPPRVFQSTSLPLTLARLDGAMKRSAKMLRKQGKSLSPGHLDNSRLGNLEAIMTNGKGKEKELSEIYERARTIDVNGLDKGSGTKVGLGPKPAWWLDISSPTWSDMREIGKMLHLHPLTLEDILHQETREKLELFPRLGYYFIVFRALESDRTRAKATQLSLTLSLDKDGRNQVPLSRGSIGATNVYIVVLRDGICTFHFEDMADHTLRVRNRILQFEETINMTSDWIAHGLLDSIVDQFFPLLNMIEKEVNDLDDLVLSMGDVQNGLLSKIDSEITVAINEEPEKISEGDMEKAKSTIEYSSATQAALPGVKSGFCVPKVKPDWASKRILFFPLAGITPSVIFRNIRKNIWPVKRAHHGQLDHIQHSSSLDAILPGKDLRDDTSSPLVRMASTRRLVTSLTRLLGTKGEVISQIRKRLVGMRMVGVPATLESDIDAATMRHAAAEVGIYLDDIQDHIQTLHQALAHYERILSHSHPAYLSHLRLSLSQARGGTDNALLLLTALSVCVVSTQIVTGVFSVNLGKIPRNGTRDRPSGAFTVFGAVIVTVIITVALVVAVTRLWWVMAGKKFKKGRRERGF